jgi:hypothetical protein
MDDNTRVLLLACIAAIAPTVAAISSIRNGRRLKDIKKNLEQFGGPRVSAQSKEPARSPIAKADDDWYVPPNFD